jgi:hypothetical protein
MDKLKSQILISINYIQMNSNGYTNALEILNKCNYIDPEKSNASDFILSCINQPNEINPIFDNNCINMSIQVDNDMDVEGFSNDHTSHGSGVSYTPLGTCHDGYIRDQEGRCVILEYRGRTRDGNWQRGHSAETMHDGKDNYKICSNGGTFLGLSNGHPRCEKNEDVEEPVIEGFSIGREEASVYEVLQK